MSFCCDQQITPSDRSLHLTAVAGLFSLSFSAGAQGGPRTIITEDQTGEGSSQKATTWELSEELPGEYPAHLLEKAEAGASVSAEGDSRGSQSKSAADLTGLGDGWSQPGWAPIPCKIEAEGQGCFLLVKLTAADDGGVRHSLPPNPEKVYLDAEVTVVHIGRTSDGALDLIAAGTANGLLHLFSLRPPLEKPAGPVAPRAVPSRGAAAATLGGELAPAGAVALAAGSGAKAAQSLEGAKRASSSSGGNNDTTAA